MNQSHGSFFNAFRGVVLVNQDNLKTICKLNVRMEKKCDLSNFERGMVGRCGLSISQSAQLQGFSRTTLSRVYKIGLLKTGKMFRSDESQFLLRHSDGRVRILRKQNGNMDPSLPLCRLVVV